MNYPESVRWLLSYADFERTGRFHDRPDIAPMSALLHELGDPHLGRRTVHVAGSKGKGSVCAMVESILREAGYWTGLYTSPHLHSYTERVRINGDPLSPEGFARMTRAIRRAVQVVERNLGDRNFVTFDLLTTLGFLAFREADVQVQVIEVGIGGLLDSTNVFETKDLAVITPISLEHTRVLGDTVEAIARQKAGIITPGCTVVVSPQPYEEAKQVISASAASANAPVVDVADSYRWRLLAVRNRRQEVRIEGPQGPLITRMPLLGAQQLENAATAVASVVALRERGAHVPEDALPEGLAAVRWPGRLEVLREQPLLIADGAHNRDSARRFREALAEYFSCRRALLIVGASADKDIKGIAEELAPLAEGVIAVKTRHPRAMEPAEIESAFSSLGVSVDVSDGIGEAIDYAGRQGAGVICVVGSLFAAAEAREHVGLAKPETILTV